MIPAGTSDETRGIAALAKSRIDELGARRFGAKWGVQSSTWWDVYLLATDGYSREQIITVFDERAAEHREWLKEPNMFDAEKVKTQLDLWAEVRAAILGLTRDPS